MTYTDPVVAQKVVTMQHVIRKSTLNVSYADPKGGPSRMAPFNQSPSPYGAPYGSHQAQRPPMGPRYPYSGQPAAPYVVPGYEGYSRAGQPAAQATAAPVCC